MHRRTGGRFSVTRMRLGATCVPRRSNWTSPFWPSAKTRTSTPNLTYLGEALSRIRIYREWSLGRDSPLRAAAEGRPSQRFPARRREKLGLGVKQVPRRASGKAASAGRFKQILRGHNRFPTLALKVARSNLFLQEGDRVIPATRLSDGTLRYLCLLAIPLPPTAAAPDMY